MRKTIKIGCLILGIIGLFILADPIQLIGAQEQVLPRPGLNLEITDVIIPETRRPEVTFTLTDQRGTPLDRTGVATEGAVSIQFILGRIDQGKRQYTAYTVREATGAALGTVEQAATDSGGTFTEVGPGTYVYRFGTVLSEGYDATVTHTVGAYASRDLSFADGNTYVAADTYDFVPDGSPVETVRDVVADTACNKCHDQLTAHGSRRTVALCILCHTPQTSDPDSGNTVDFNVMIHKIHRGAELPSVQAGTPYRIIGFRQSVHDYSTVELPQDIRNCATCHAGSQGMNAMTQPSRAACGACHDNLNFATGEGHHGIVQTNDNSCKFCHRPNDGLEFDLSVAGAHTVPTKSTQLPGVNYQIVGVENTNPGDSPSVVFNIKDDAGNTIAPGQMSRLSLLLAGPTSDYGEVYSEDARAAMPAGDGNFMYTFGQAIPMGASGTWSVGIEGRLNFTLNPGTDREMSVRDSGRNVVFPFAVTGQLMDRRQVVDIAKCDACHDSLRLHGDNRVDNIQHCTSCHNPNGTDIARRPAEALPAEGIDFKYMIHRIHTGEELENEFTVYGFGNTAHDFTEVRFPGNRMNCTMCHLTGTQLIGSTAGRLPTMTPRSLVNPTPPISAACVGCHDGEDTLLHVSLNAAPFGESCAVCHGEGRDFAVSRVHFKRPDAR